MSKWVCWTLETNLKLLNHTPVSPNNRKAQTNHNNRAVLTTAFLLLQTPSVLSLSIQWLIRSKISTRTLLLLHICSPICSPCYYTFERVQRWADVIKQRLVYGSRLSDTRISEFSIDSYHFNKNSCSMIWTERWGDQSYAQRPIAHSNAADAILFKVTGGNNCVTWKVFTELREVRELSQSVANSSQIKSAENKTSAACEAGNTRRMWVNDVSLIERAKR